jgi:hypothetical protein
MVAPVAAGAGWETGPNRELKMLSQIIAGLATL